MLFTSALLLIATSALAAVLPCPKDSSNGNAIFIDPPIKATCAAYEQRCCNRGDQGCLDSGYGEPCCSWYQSCWPKYDSAGRHYEDICTVAPIRLAEMMLSRRMVEQVRKD
ncbi:hypothetical protein CLAFUW4_20076 [Fulvia fulva]|uniref:uncharacterized protein n=1 Tax=Passalora fulva TaxID=5499 RepID=UPI002852A7BD|nr:uncharacterized protein CLAFUR5_20076 [Fulvia fulva]KAK4613651.1 hypothetical protein CLAFUR4_20076 [Fulvia fulva]KAK4615271.1 hypothetical protein CLAFUR0_20076 [Fulvia fulva]WMI38996.1 hypothetical protein CLAFUR5_20076 [Fulvia fulva]WPV20203.1 hypothetical protein CLAFUW4_20076 [Fulvia fulva]WPV35245.1 hypothetical protein CLAFUW7_20076 [Fulvia fulva]